ncbi:MAG: sulfatase [Patescibacteria group bacterium]
MRRISIVLSIGFLIIVIYTAEDYLSQRPPSTVSPCINCNVIIIGLDAWQAAHISHLGYPVKTTPTLDTLSKNGFTFSQAISASSWTVPSFMSIFTGTYPSIHKVTNKFVVFSKEKQKLTNIQELSPQIKTLAEILLQQNYRTAGFTGDAGVSGAFGYNKGFETYVDDTKFGGFDKNLDAALQWTKDSANENKPFFMFFHGYDAHGQFAIPVNYKSRFVEKDYTGPFRGTPQEQESLRERGLRGENLNLTQEDIAFWRAWYDGKIRDADERLGKFIDGLRKQGLLNNTIIVLVGDHGTELYEHKHFDHGHTLYDELIRVPLVFVIPGSNGGLHIEKQVSTIDIFPTILELLGILPTAELSRQLAGTSFVPLFRGEGAGRDVFIETDYRNFIHARGIRTIEGIKYILNLDTNMEELYDLKVDPEETRNLAKERPELLESLRQRVTRHIEEMGGMPIFSNECLPVYDSQCK